MLWIAAGGFGTTDTAVYRPGVLASNTASSYISYVTNAANGLVMTLISNGTYSVFGYAEVSSTRNVAVGFTLDGTADTLTGSPYGYTNVICRGWDYAHDGLGGAANCSGQFYGTSNQVLRFHVKSSDGTIAGSVVPITVRVERTGD